MDRQTKLGHRVLSGVEAVATGFSVQAIVRQNETTGIVLQPLAVLSCTETWECGEF